jgi:hypothetical protein
MRFVSMAILAICLVAIAAVPEVRACKGSGSSAREGLLARGLFSHKIFSGCGARGAANVSTARITVRQTTRHYQKMPVGPCRK